MESESLSPPTLAQSGQSRQAVRIGYNDFVSPEHAVHRIGDFPGLIVGNDIGGEFQQPTPYAFSNELAAAT